MTHEEMQNELLRMEADMIDLGQITHQTAHNLDRLTGVVDRLAESQQQAWQSIDRMSKRIDHLSDRIDRFIASQSDGHHDGEGDGEGDGD